LKRRLNSVDWELEVEEPMYVCVCNAIRESDIRRCVTDKGARTPMEVFRAMGASPQCRMCIPDIRQLVQDVLRETSALEQAIAAVRDVDRLAS
jgi:bacterioferritin-associated ferredoxin